MTLAGRRRVGSEGFVGVAGRRCTSEDFVDDLDVARIRKDHGSVGFIV